MKKFISTILAVVMAVPTCLMVANAEVSAAKSASTALTATANSTYTITVPESVAMTSSSSGAGAYTGTVPVNLKGDIEENAKIVVTATATTMTCGTSSAAVSFTAKPKTEWTRTDLLNNGTTSNYKVQATLTPGQWKGTATFSCEKLYSVNIHVLAGEISSNTSYEGTATIMYKNGWTWKEFMASGYNDEADLTPADETTNSSVVCGFVMRFIPAYAQGTYALLYGVKADGTKVPILQNEIVGSNDYVRLTAGQ